MLLSEPIQNDLPVIHQGLQFQTIISSLSSPLKLQHLFSILTLSWWPCFLVHWEDWSNWRRASRNQPSITTVTIPTHLPASVHVHLSWLIKFPLLLKPDSLLVHKFPYGLTQNISVSLLPYSQFLFSLDSILTNSHNYRIKKKNYSWFQFNSQPSSIFFSAVDSKTFWKSPLYSLVPIPFSSCS